MVRSGRIGAGLVQVLSLVTATPSMTIMAYGEKWSDWCRIGAGVVAGHGNSFNEYYGI